MVRQVGVGVAGPTALLIVALACLLGLPGWLLADDDPPFQPAEPVPAAKPAPESPSPTAAGAPAGVDPDTKCLITGEPWAKSSTRVEAVFNVDGRRLRGKFLSLAYMLIEYKLLKEDKHQVEIESVSVLDFPTFGSGNERLVTINEDWDNVDFLKTDSPLAGTHEPYYAAFASLEELKKAKDSLGGKVQTYEDVLKTLLHALSAGDDKPTADTDEINGMRRHPKFGELTAP